MQTWVYEFCFWLFLHVYSNTKISVYKNFWPRPHSHRLHFSAPSFMWVYQSAKSVITLEICTKLPLEVLNLYSVSFFHTALNQVSTHLEYERVNFDNLVNITFLFIAINYLLLSLCTIQWKSNPNDWAK